MFCRDNKIEEACTTNILYCFALYVSAVCMLHILTQCVAIEMMYVYGVCGCGCGCEDGASVECEWFLCSTRGCTVLQLITS